MRISTHNSYPKIWDFAICKNLGEGRFGTVHQIVHKLTGAIFALKKIPK
jgi:serine/threonine protein kinase